MEHLLPGLVAFGMVTVEKARRGFAVQHQPELPAEIVGILHAGVHALATDVGANMGGVPQQEDAAGLVPLRLTAMDTVANVPDGVAQHATRGPGIEYRLQVLQARRGRRMVSLGWANIGND